jgi:hypothetical protein
VVLLSLPCAAGVACSRSDLSVFVALCWEGVYIYTSLITRGALPTRIRANDEDSKKGAPPGAKAAIQLNRENIRCRASPVSNTIL